MSSTFSHTIHPLKNDILHQENEQKSHLISSGHPHPPHCSYNRFRRRETEPLLWPKYISYLRHPQATNFYILPSCYEKVQHMSSIQQQPLPFRFHSTTHGEWIKHSSSYHTPTSHSPISYTTDCSHPRRSKRKFEEVQEENEDQMLSVFLDFDNVT